MIYAQYALLALFILGTFMNLYYSIEGRPAKDGEGFKGAIETISIGALVFMLYCIAGTFSLIF